MSAKMSLPPAARVAIARIGPSGSLAEPPAGLAAEARSAEPVDGGLEVYCLRYGHELAARGLAPCSDLGCNGCTSHRRAEKPGHRTAGTA